MMPSPTTNIILLSRVTKTIRRQVVLQEINLSLPPGRIYGFVGKNGSGKTMLFRVICGLAIPDSGQVSVFDCKVGNKGGFPPSTGALIETPGFLPQYSGLTNLKLLASIRGQIGEAEIRASMVRVGLDPDLRKPVRAYSMGMRQRLGLAQAIMEDPSLLVLDEPSNGLDLQGVRMLHQLLHELRAQGKTILLASHSLEEIGTLCDRVFRMDLGHLSETESGT